MSNELLLIEVEKCREQMHRVIDAQFDLVVRSLQAGDPLPLQETDASPREVILPLCLDLSHFKGRKPMAVIFPDGRRTEVKTWKAAVAAVLQDCANTAPCSERLMAIRGKVMGRDRVILAASPKGMDVPMEIGPELFVEGKFDTASLLYVLTKRILEPVGYSYHSINIQLRPQ